MSDPKTPTTTEGTVAFRGYRTWYRIVGDPATAAGKLPLLVLHGGPGAPHDYLEDLAALSAGGRPVVFYDQLGCGRSDHPDDPALWTLDTLVEELVTVREALALGPMHLLGHSAGGWLALEYMLGKPRDLVSLVLSSTCASMPEFAVEGRRLKQLLPPAVQETIDRHEQAGTTDDPDYVDATMAFYTQRLCRRVPFPDHVMSSMNNWREDIYATMFGTEWNITGNLRDWDVTARLGEIDLPVLVTSGHYDEMTPTVVKPLVEGIPDAEWTVFDDSAHLASVEEPERYRAVVEAFLARSESARNSAPA